MKFKPIFLVVIIIAAFVGFGLHSHISAETADDHAGQGKEDFFSDIHDHENHEDHEDHEDHEMATDHSDHAHDTNNKTDDHDNVDDHGDMDDHDAHAEEADGSHEGHGHAEGAFIDPMTAAQIKEAGIVTDTLKTGSISRQIHLTGEVFFDQDRMVHLVPRISGVVASVNKKQGDPVKKGEELAVIHSRELTDIKSEYLSAIERIANAKINFEREKSLWEKKIIAEKQFLETKQAFIETRIDMQAAERKLHALGFSEAYIADLPNQPHETLFEYRLTAPSDGVIIEKHIVQGELVTAESPVFIIADTASVWVDLQVYPRDLPEIKTGQKVFVSALDESLSAQGVISFISSSVSLETRTALARVEVPNTGRQWRAGLFANAVVTPASKKDDATLVVRKSAVQIIDGKPSLFIATTEGYFPVTVETGLSGKTHIEILSGVTAGQTYVRNGSYELKAKLVTSTLDSHAGHGH